MNTILTILIFYILISLLIGLEILIFDKELEFTNMSHNELAFSMGIVWPITCYAMINEIKNM